LYPNSLKSIQISFFKICDYGQERLKAICNANWWYLDCLHNHLQPDKGLGRYTNLRTVQIFTYDLNSIHTVKIWPFSHIWYEHDIKRKYFNKFNFDIYAQPLQLDEEEKWPEISVSLSKYFFSLNYSCKNHIIVELELVNTLLYWFLDLANLGHIKVTFRAL